jgi:hypothetical protein
MTDHVWAAHPVFGEFSRDVLGEPGHEIDVRGHRQVDREGACEAGHPRHHTVPVEPGCAQQHQARVVHGISPGSE